MQKFVGAVLCLSLLAAAAGARAQETLLQPCESLQGAKMTWGGQVADSRMELNTDPKYVTQGKASIHAYSIYPADAKGNCYVGFRLPVPAAAMKGKAIAFDAWTAQPATKALYLRGHNQAGKCVVSWQSWTGLLKQTPTTFIFTPGVSAAGTIWEAKEIAAPDAPIVSVEFIAGTAEKNKPFDIYIDNVRLVPAAATAANPAAPAAAKIAGFETGESIRGVTVTTGEKDPNTVLDLNTDPKYISAGKASIHFAGKAAPNATASTYVSIDVPAGGADMRGHALAFDAWSDEPEATKGLYVRAFDARGNCVASWLTWAAKWDGKASFLLMPGGSSGLQWEPGMVKSNDVSSIAKLRFYIGTRTPGARFSIYLDNIRFVASQTQAFGSITKAAPLFPNTALVTDGKPEAVIVTPAGADWKALGDELAAAIRAAAGADLPVKSAEDLTDQDLHATNAIALGNVVNNRRLLYPYSHSMIFADDLYPGKGGYDLRSVHDPWGAGHNMISIGSTDLAGARAGIEAFKKILKPESGKLQIGRTLQVKLTGAAQDKWGARFNDPGDKYVEDQKKTAETGLKTGVHTGLFGQAANVGHLYALTRKAPYAQAFVWLIKRAKSHYDTKPDTYGGPWGMDSDFAIYRTMPNWDEVEECEALTDEDRLDVSRILFQWVSEVGATKGNAQGRRVRFNHQTFPALGITYAGHYFVKHYRSAEAQQWLDIAANNFDLQIETYKPHCDCNTYQWLTLFHTVRYSLATQNLKYFENGNARRNVDYAILTMNNLGYQVAYGDIGGWGTIGTEVPIMQAAEWFYRDGRAIWAIDKKREVSKRYELSEFTTESSQPKRPDDLIGARVWPLAELWYETFLTQSGIPYENTVDKVAFRNGFEPNDQYLLLDGLSVGGHRHMDGNSILGWSQNNRIWLADGDYIKALPKYHNGVLILRDGQSATIPDACELVAFADLPAVAVSRTAMRKYAGADWTRNIVWIKDNAFIVVDQMQALEDGEFSFRAVWQTVGQVEKQGAALQINQEGQFARFAMSDDTTALLHDDESLGKNWASYPYSKEAVIRVFQGIASANLKKGEGVDIFTALHASGDKPSAARVARVAPNAAVVTGLGEPVLIVAPRPGMTQVLPGLVEGEAELFIVTPRRIAAVGATRLAVLGAEQTFSTPTDVEVETATGARTTVSPTRRSPAAEPKTSTDQWTLKGKADALAPAIEALLAKAAPAAAPAAAGPQAPEIAPLWKYASIPDRFLLTNNAGAFGAVDIGLKTSCSPAPLSANVFSQEEGANTLDHAFDGQEDGTSGCVMWGDNQEVTINIDFDKPCDISSVILKAWFALTSSKNKLYQLGALRILASNDAFQSDNRELVNYKDTETHPTWGAPVAYPFENLKGQAKNIRLVLTPRPGTGIYLSEIEVWGKPADLKPETAAANLLDTFTCVSAADLDGDKVDEVLAGAKSGFVYCINADGTLRWKFNTNGPVADVTAVDFAGDGKRWVIAGGTTCKIFAIDGAGNLKWTYDVPLYKRAGKIRVAFPADLDGKGKQVAIVGAENWRYYALNAEGKKIWHYESVHPSTAGTAVDLNGDGKQELALGTAYYWWHLVSPEGKKLAGIRTEGGPGATSVAAGDIAGDKNPEVMFGGEDTFVQVFDAAGKSLWKFNTGDEVTAVAAARVNPQDKDRVFVTSLSFNVYSLDGAGKMLWRQDLGAPVRAAALAQTAGQTLLGAGCDNGVFYKLDAAKAGEAVGRTLTGGQIVDIAPANFGDKSAFITAGANGYLYAIPAGK